ncbi:MAG: DMT family transporter [Gammaproteobacteria bacterium]|nr:DMT family transporter [Gammaproteobacteria bacterium]
MDSLRSAARRTLHPLSARWSRLPGSLRGAVWTLLAAVGFTGMSVCIKFAGQTMPVWEIIVLRAGFALTIFAPAIARSGLASFRTERFGAHFLRAVFGVLGVSTMMLSITHLDLTLATTLGFTRALFMIVLAVVFLGELIRWRRSIATFVGFIGVVICMQPDPSGIDPWILVGLLAALFAAGVTTMIKRLTATEPPLRIIVLSYLMIGLMAAIPAWAVWKAPTFSELAIIALMGLFSAWGQTCMVHGLRAADATIVVPLDYTRLLYAAIIGFFVFSEVPSWSTWVGGAIIVSSTLYIALREAYLA